MRNNYILAIIKIIKSILINRMDKNNNNTNRLSNNSSRIKLNININNNIYNNNNSEIDKNILFEDYIFISWDTDSLVIFF